MDAGSVFHILLIQMDIQLQQLIIYRTEYRHVFRLFKGSIPNGYAIRHTCDNRLCINPEHLLIGTHKDNVLDRVKRSRSAKGEDNGRSKLTESEVIAILKDTATPKMKLAKIYNVDAKVIRDIKNGITWKSVTGL